MRTSKIVLGTVQFGLNYGINNSNGQTDEEEVAHILEEANHNFIYTLDTSAAYGNSESVLGRNIGNIPFNIISKYPQGKLSVEEVFNNSLKLLKTNSLYGYLVHHFEFYQSCPEIFDSFRKLKEDNKVRKIGFSIYNPEQLQILLDKNVKFDIIQFPYNIFDRQFEPYFPTLLELGIEVHTRSAFLQGLFFKDTNTLPSYLLPLKRDLDSLHEYCKGNEISLESMALNYLIDNQFIDGVLIGVDNCEQLKKNINTVQNKLSPKDIDFIDSIIIKDKRLLNPVNWH